MFVWVCGVLCVWVSVFVWVGGVLCVEVCISVSFYVSVCETERVVRLIPVAYCQGTQTHTVDNLTDYTDIDKGPCFMIPILKPFLARGLAILLRNILSYPQPKPTY